LKSRINANHDCLKMHGHKIEGINSRLDGLQAAILSVKLKYINDWNRKRYENARVYNELLKDMSGIVTPRIRNSGNHIFHVYAIQVEKRDSLMKFLREKGIMTQIHYPCTQPFLYAYRHLGYKPEDFPVSFSMTNKLLSLPMYSELTRNKTEYVVDKIKEFVDTHI